MNDSNRPSPPPARSYGSQGQWFVVALALVAMLVATIGFSTPEEEPELAAAGAGAGYELVFEDPSEGTGGEQGSGGGRRVVTSGGGGDGGAAGGGSTGGPTGGGTTGPAGPISPQAQADCDKGINGGATDQGVTDKEIRFAATIVKTGIARDFLSDAQFGMEAVRRKVNASGGVCGRQITIDYQDDGWDPTTGQRIIEGWISSKKYFGLAVNPSSEGLKGAIDSGLINQNKFPVVGADGMLENQYTSPWVWPVATSTAAVMRIMADKAIEDGAKKFGIVWENNYRFGVEGHDAFVKYVKKKLGNNAITADVGIAGGQNDYGTEVNNFLDACGGSGSLSKCDFIAFLLEPATASQWKRNGGFGDPDVRPKVGMGAPQPLFLDSFARDCGAACTDLWVWTSFKPPLDPFDSEAAVQQYERDLANVNGNADPNNPHVQGAYVGMDLLVKALEQLGPNPTREGIQKVLDSMVYESKQGPVLDFKKKGKYAADSAQAFEVLVNNDSFAGWRYTNTGFLEDPGA